MNLDLLNENSKVSIRRLIAYTWTLVVVILFLLAFAFQLKVPDGTITLTGIAWAAYTVKNSHYLHKDEKKQE